MKNQVSPPALTTAAPVPLASAVGVVGPVHRGRRAGLAGEIGRRRAGNDDYLVLGPRHFLHRQRDARCRQVGDHLHALLVEPLAGDRRRDIGLVLVVGADDFDLLAEHRAAEIVDRHLRRDDRAGPAQIGVKARHVGEHADLDRVRQVCAWAVPAKQQRRESRAITARLIFPPAFFKALRPRDTVQLVDIRGQIGVGDGVDNTAVLDDVVAIGDGRGKAEILLDQQDREALFLQGAHAPRRSAGR
jgi:hypothetical protein